MVTTIGVVGPSDLVTSSRAREAFNLSAETDKERDRYGRGTFGQSVLLARRMLEAGVRLVTVYWHRDKPGVDTTWDTHGQNFKQLKERLVPQTDQPVEIAGVYGAEEAREVIRRSQQDYTARYAAVQTLLASAAGR